MKKKLLAALLCVSMLLSACSALLVFAEPVDEFAALRDKWNELLTGTDSYDLTDPEIKAQVDTITETANTQWAAMNKDASLGYLWEEASNWATSNTIAGNATRLYNLALAYATYGSPLKGDAALLADIEYGLTWLNENKYSTTIAPYDNWYDWEIGIPRTLNNILVLLYDDMTPALRDSLVAAMLKYSPDPARGAASTYRPASIRRFPSEKLQTSVRQRTLKGRTRRRPRRQTASSRIPSEALQTSALGPC